LAFAFLSVLLVRAPTLARRSLIKPARRRRRLLWQRQWSSLRSSLRSRLARRLDRDARGRIELLAWLGAAAAAAAVVVVILLRF
jgi:hypothetical protein